ncbi:unnamed protein product [Clavelina lepadiformis]|uniref:Endoglucanase n=1 Tax=Clavelina lepadiformis TaxID=159417 RepID=A0ABP0G2J1_CLALP
MAFYSNMLLFEIMLVSLLAGVTLCGGNIPDSCGILTPPSNGVILHCSRGSRSNSRCIVKCKNGISTAQSIRICKCSERICLWEGFNPNCEVGQCELPIHKEGSIVLLEEWFGGFTALINLGFLPALDDGWSAVVIFEQPLGSNARITSLTSDVTSISPSKNSFTLSSKEGSPARNISTSNSLHSVFSVTEVETRTPSLGYVGIYNHRVTDVVCLNPPGPMKPIVKFSFSQTLCSNSNMSATSSPFTTSSRVVSPLVNESTGISSNQGLHVETTSATSLVDNNTSSMTTSHLSVATTISPRTFLMEIDGMQCKRQNDESYRTQPGWVDGGFSYFSGNALVEVTQSATKWLVVVVFQLPITSIQVWNTIIKGNQSNGLLWKFGPIGYNSQLSPGKLDVRFIAKMQTQSDNMAAGEVYFCSSYFGTGDPIWLPFEERTNASNAPINKQHEENSRVPVSLSTTTSSLGLTTTTHSDVRRLTPVPRLTNQRRCASSAPYGIRPRRSSQTVPRWKRSRDGSKYDFNELLHKSILFYEAQRSGSLPNNYNRITWRGNSMLKDGCSIAVDLSGGWFDAGDFVKFTFPMAAAVTNLAWGGIVYRKAYVHAGLLPRFLGSLKWPVTYLINAHTAQNELVGLVGDVRADHDNWSRPEDWNQDRPVFKITKDAPGTELAAETAAALASSSLVLKRTHPSVASQALRHAKQLFNFAVQYRGHYHEAIPQVNEFYHSYSGFNDELMWAAAWLFKATTQQRYLSYAERLFDSLGGTHITGSEFSWDNKMIGAQVLLANITGHDKYRNGVIRFMNKMLTEAPKTPSGMLWVREKGPCRYAANAALIGLLAGELEPPLPERRKYLKWAEKQIHLLVGDDGRSYVVGFGKDYPKRPHHRSSSCPRPPATCDWTTYHSNRPNHFILYGALVGGPSKMGQYDDDRENFHQSEVAIDFNAGFQSAVAGLKMLARRNRNK